MKRYGFYITGKSTRLLKYLQNASEKQVKCLKLVFSDEKIPLELENLIKEKKIKLEYIIYSQLNGDLYEKRKFLSNSLLNSLKKNDINYCFCFGEHILEGELLDEYKNRIINFHPAILPMYPGMNAIDQAVNEKKAFIVGNTAHFINEGVDTGPIIMQSVKCIYEFLKTMDYAIILDLQIDMLCKLIDLLNENRIHVIDNQVVIEGANYSIAHIYPEV